MTYMSKIIYANMGVKSFVKTSTIQPAAPKLFTVHFDILNLKNLKMKILLIFWVDVITIYINNRFLKFCLIWC